MKTLAFQFDEMMLAMGLKDATTLQRTEMRRAFMGGAACMLRSLEEGADDENEDRATARLMEFHAELMRFHQGIGRDGR